MSCYPRTAALQSTFQRRQARADQCQRKQQQRLPDDRVADEAVRGNQRRERRPARQESHRCQRQRVSIAERKRQHRPERRVRHVPGLSPPARPQSAGNQRH